MSSSLPASLPSELAATVQAAHIRTDPDPRLDLAPSTAAEEKQLFSAEPPRRGTADDSAPEDDDEVDDGIDDNDDDIPCSVLRPAPPRRHNLPPLPDLRFEQSYLHSISNADTWWKVMLITARDQIVMPLAQGLLYNLLLNGWQYSRRNARFHGTSSGARFRRWWYGVNNWPIPRGKT